jgi:hypothetical protein
MMRMMTYSVTIRIKIATKTASLQLLLSLNFLKIHSLKMISQPASVLYSKFELVRTKYNLIREQS